MGVLLMLYETPICRIMGDRALLIELGDEISAAMCLKVRQMFLTIEAYWIEGLLEMVPAYQSLLLIYDPLAICLPALMDRVMALARTATCTTPQKAPLHSVPVVYGGEYGPDLDWVARFHGISAGQVIRLHTTTNYQVYMIGFTPGFAYLGELPDGLDTPRKKTPRVRVKAGSVGIARRQTGIYSVDSPGGWQIIGRTPLTLFDPEREPPTRFKMGDLVRFYSAKE
jgi:KipI family sensor histidine kinase inhibitor